MSGTSIAFAAVYLALLVCYLFVETSGNFRARAVNKIVMASLFLLYSAAALLRAGRWSAFDALELAAVFFSFVGDCFLLWSFVKGGVTFGTGNLLFLACELVLALSEGVPFARLAWAVPLFALLWGGYLLLERRGHLPGRYSRTFALYLATTTAHGCLGLALALALRDPRTALLGGGLALFMLSDYFLGFYHFLPHVRGKKWILRCNSASYFTGMLLVAFSTTI